MATLALQPSLLDDEAFAPRRDAPPPDGDFAPATPSPAAAATTCSPGAVAAATTSSPGAVAAATTSSPGAVAAGASGGRTLEDLLVAAWDALSGAHAATCLVCGGEVAPRYAAEPKPVAGRCRDCGTEIS